MFHICQWYAIGWLRMILSIVSMSIDWFDQSKAKDLHDRFQFSIISCFSSKVFGFCWCINNNETFESFMKKDELFTSNLWCCLFFSFLFSSYMIKVCCDIALQGYFKLIQSNSCHIYKLTFFLIEWSVRLITTVRLIFTAHESVKN